MSSGIMELTPAVNKAVLLMFISLNFRLLEFILQLLIFGVSYAQALICIYPNDYYSELTCSALLSVQNRS